MSKFLSRSNFAGAAMALSTAFMSMAAHAQETPAPAPNLEDYMSVTFGGDLSGDDPYSIWWTGVSSVIAQNCGMYGMMGVQPFQAPYTGDDSMKGYDWFVVNGEKGCQTGTGFQGTKDAILAKAAELNEARRQKMKRQQQGLIPPEPLQPQNTIIGPAGIIPNPTNE